MARAYRCYTCFRLINGFALLCLMLEMPFSAGILVQSTLAAERLEKPSGGRNPGKNEFDLDALADRVRASTSIGFLTKLSLRNQVDDLVEAFRRFHSGERNPPLAELRQSFNFLIMKITSLVQDNEPELANDIFNARGVLWARLTDPKEFSKI